MEIVRTRTTDKSGLCDGEKERVPPTPPGAAAADGNGADREFQRECVREGRDVLEEEEGR